VQAIRQPHGHVREAVDLLQRHALAVEPAEHGAAALGPEVDRQVPGTLAHRRGTLQADS
jgi:hypothetical protein